MLRGSAGRQVRAPPRAPLGARHWAGSRGQTPGWWAGAGGAWASLHGSRLSHSHGAELVSACALFLLLLLNLVLIGREDRLRRREVERRLRGIIEQIQGEGAARRGQGVWGSRLWDVSVVPGKPGEGWDLLPTFGDCSGPGSGSGLCLPVGHGEGGGGQMGAPF